MQTHEPTMIEVDSELLRSVVAALETGLEHAESVRREHDTSLGRTIRKNRLWGESLDKDVATLRLERNKVRKALGWPEIPSK